MITNENGAPGQGCAALETLGRTPNHDGFEGNTRNRVIASSETSTLVEVERAVSGKRDVWLRAYTYARQAAMRGHHVIPIGPMKLPAIRSPHRDDSPGTPQCRGLCGRPGHGVHDATDEPVRLGELFEAAPHATGYGIACGVGKHLLVGIDLDRKNGVDGVASLEALEEQQGFTMPDTTVVYSATGGEHRWLRLPPGVLVGNSAGKLGPGIDVRGYGGFLVGPGSWTPKGTYRFAERRPVADVPEALLNLMLPPPVMAKPWQHKAVTDADRRTDGIAGLAAWVANQSPGGRNDATYWAACRAIEGGHRAELHLLVEAAVQAGLSETEAQRTVSSADRRLAGAA